MALCDEASTGRSILHNKVLALLKWEADAQDLVALPHLSIRLDSQDAWVYRAPMRDSVIAGADFYLGQPKCDNRLAHLLQEAGYIVSNAALAVRAVEVPYAQAVPVYDALAAVAGEVRDLLLTDDRLEYS